MVLLLDNYDSFSYNLAGYLSQLQLDCSVIRNDACSLKEIIDMEPEAIVLSPGPKKPRNAGIMMELIDIFHDKVPILGICLGHQAIGQYFGATLSMADKPVHGKTSVIKCKSDPIFKGLPKEIEVMRYHSLILNMVNSNDLDIIATTESKVTMAIIHKKFPIYGLQFHPESILTETGMKLLSNWVNLNNLNKKCD